MQPIKKSVYQKNKSTISFMLDFQENIYNNNNNKTNYYLSDSFAGRKIVGLGNLSTDVFLEV